MDNSKKTISKIIVFLLLVFFPFGQIIKFNLNFFQNNISVHPIDIIAGLSFIYLIFNKITPFPISRIIKAFLIYLCFSFLVSLGIFNFQQGIIGALYLLRLIFYISLFLVIYDLAKNSNDLKILFFNSLIAVLLFVGIFGWIQYFLYPDIRNFTIWGWDDHFYRLIGTFLDPGYISILLVFGFILTFVKFLNSKNKKLLLLLFFFFISLGFTYSRAGYVALIGGIGLILILRKKIKYLILLAVFFLIMIFLLPRPESEGVKLERVFSIILRLRNYQETIFIWQKSPLFGIGYNNLCFAKIKFLGKGGMDSHSCSGSDSSLLGFMATSGFLGLVLFFQLIKKVIINIKNDYLGTSFLACITALAIHSLFINSLFYPWVMGFMAILAGISLKNLKGEFYRK